jgi:hypothetical protein
VGAAEHRPAPSWGVLVEVYEAALTELTELDDPHLEPLIEELTRLYGQAMLELDLRERAQRTTALASRVGRA